MRFRQVHLDFHTSEAIDGIGKQFDKKQFQEMLQLGHVDSITVFSKCHHGWAYHPSTANEMHPGLGFDLLGAQIEAAHEIGVKTPVYLSAGLDEKLALRHPEWLIRDAQGLTNWVKSFLEPGYHQFCLNSPYLDILIAQIEEVVRNYDADGIFLDIVGVRSCLCHTCIQTLRGAGEDPRDADAVLALGERTYANYARRVREAIDAIKPGLPVFHNGGHIRRGRRDLAAMNSHLELESLPTGGWGYDHFPLSARYAQGLGMPFLGMTGKFHTSWGEFGGFKHPNALRYETSLSLANGARCSIGDQLHPEGFMDPATYSLIGAAYREVEEKEGWCAEARGIADVALLSTEAFRSAGSERTEDRTGAADTGAVRMLLEGHILFDVADRETDFSPYKVLVLPDEIPVDAELAARLEAYVAQGGKLLATGRSGLRPDGSGFALDLGVTREGDSPFSPSYFRPYFELPSLSGSAFVFYGAGQNVQASDSARVLGHRENPYFNREAFTFCSHRHTPSALRNDGPGMVATGHSVYIAWDVFSDYATKGSLALKETVLYALSLLLPAPALTTTLPAQGIVTLTEQPEERRYVNHLLYAVPVKRGQNIEVIEDIVPLFDIEVTARIGAKPRGVYLAPQLTPLSFQAEEESGTGSFAVRYTVPRLECHQMVVIDI
ncbi:Beta-galactosidase GanA [Paenibacillus sp. UNCCL117]|uniref:beta-galactosidase trimerization domain-containing protein n=1 Tax=unclassified Paenibacillus TaxID=185978 RepID=UPI000884F32D|nr:MULTISPECIES: beta-galactosidase trimerization domain-containing protein [unclassified Paenibacillus]SDD58558.1 Beta-galactosidase GanA [Paenibacillus sp. cl123]SFW50992.1 Beta-galactosidase GanA [Paenibacillus sp. UNCCL117]